MSKPGLLWSGCLRTNNANANGAARMIALFLNIVLLVRTFWHGLRHDAEFRALAVLLLFTLFLGTVFYWQVEEWSFLDSLYFCVMTVATIGYGDFAPTTDVSKVFTIGFAILGIGLFASFVAKLVALRLDLHIQARQTRHHARKE